MRRARLAGREGGLALEREALVVHAAVAAVLSDVLVGGERGDRALRRGGDRLLERAGAVREVAGREHALGVGAHRTVDVDLAGVGVELDAEALGERDARVGAGLDEQRVEVERVGAVERAAEADAA